MDVRGISEQECARLASVLRKQGKPTYNVAMTADDKTAADAVELLLRVGLEAAQNQVH